MSWNNPIPWNSRTEPPVRTEGMSAGAANAASVGTSKFSPAAAGAIASAGSSLLGSVFNYFSQRATNRSNERMNRENNEYNLRLWQMNNEYNTPAAQRRRMEEAGFNPNLMYGSISPGNSSAPAQSESHYNEAPQIGDLGAAFGNAYQLYKQSQLMDKQMEAQELINQGQAIKNKQEAKQLGWMDEKREEEKSNANAVLEQIRAQTDGFRSQILTDGVLRRKLETEIDKIKADKNVSDQQAYSIYLDNIFKSETMEIRKQQLQAQLNYTNAQINYIAEQAKALQYQNLMESFREPYYEEYAKNEQAMASREEMISDYRWRAAKFEYQVMYGQFSDEFGNANDYSKWLQCIEGFNGGVFGSLVAPASTVAKFVVTKGR